MTSERNQTAFEIVLVKECVEGDRQAQHKLYTLYASKMFAICMRYVSNKQDAQDLFQEGFIKIFKTLHKFKGEGSLEGWIRRIFVFLCIDYLRKKGRQHNVEIENVEIVDSELSGYDKVSMNDLLHLIQGLPDSYRASINLYMVEGYNHKQIGEIMNISETASKIQLYRAKLLLQEKILTLEGQY